MAPVVNRRIGFDEDAALWGDDGSSDEETGVSTSLEASSVKGIENRLGLMQQLELSEEDRPAIVPYEEVCIHDPAFLSGGVVWP